MNLLDEQIRQDQRELLRRWRIPHRQIGQDMAPSGIQDVEIIPWLHSMKRTTFFTHDRWFYKPRLCHIAYCLVWLDLKDTKAAQFIRRLLSYPMLKTQAARAGKVVRVHPRGLEVWTGGATRSVKLNWLP